MLQRAECTPVKTDHLVFIGILVVALNRPFRIIVVNTINFLVLMHEHTKLPRLLERPAAMSNTKDELCTKADDSYSKEGFINSAPIYKGKVDDNERVQ